MPTTADGVIPGWFYLVRKKGEVELSFGACAECHTRAMPDGSFVKGAQGNFPVAQSRAWRGIGRGPELAQRTLQSARSQDFAPWAPNQDTWDQITLEEIIRRLQAMPPGVMKHEGTSSRHPARVPSLIAIADLRYLEATGLSRNRNLGDLMRYAIVNQGLISLAHLWRFRPERHATRRQHSIQRRAALRTLFISRIFEASAKSECSQ
jgi:hypothetical protein